MPASPFNTPLRYPGGKGRLSKYVSEVIEINGLNDGAYVEPYAGGAGIAISLLFSEKVRTIYLNDISKPIYCFWSSVINNPDEFCNRIIDTKITIEEWRKQKSIIDSTEGHSEIEIGFSTFFLNRTNRSGIIQGGVIGGQKQAGKWKLDARFNKVDLIKRIRRISEYKNRIKLSSLDAKDFITDKVPTIGSNSLIYLDPPYYIKGGGLYEHNYKEKDHEQISELVQNHINQPWIASYDNHPIISNLYKNRRQETFSLHYSANNRFTGTELMIFSDRIRTPEKIRPSRSPAT